jgi:acetyltransferase-like isoleucine patch superfamily enzyme
MSFKAIISQNIRLRYPETLLVGEGSIIDDFCYVASRLEIGRFTHVANGCSFGGGGRERLCKIGDFSSLSAGVKVWCGSDDFARDLVSLYPPEIESFKENFIAGDVIFENMNAVGANSVIMPKNIIPEGTVIGALSFVPVDFPFERWMVYAGNPLRKIRPRDRDSVLRQRDIFEMRLAQHGKDL